MRMQAQSSVCDTIELCQSSVLSAPVELCCELCRFAPGPHIKCSNSPRDISLEKCCMPSLDGSLWGAL